MSKTVQLVCVIILSPHMGLSPEKDLLPLSGIEPCGNLWTIIMDSVFITVYFALEILNI